MDWYDGYGHMGNGGWVLMTLMMIAFWAVVVLLSILVFRQVTGSTSHRNDASSARDPGAILDERFALGEVDQDEYLARKKALHSRG